MRRALTGVLAIAVLLSAGCLLLPRSYRVQASTNPVDLLGTKFTVDWADPAAVPLDGGRAEVYVTKNFFGNVPSWQTDLAKGGQVNLHDALPTLPGWTTGELVWAPTVRWLGGRYVMYFSASRAGGANCIGAAISATAEGVFTPMDVHWCGGVDAGFLDPYLFVDPNNGTPYMLMSVQVRPDGGSFIASQQLTPNGLGFSGPARFLLTYGDAHAMAGGGSLGPAAFVENPAVVVDPYNGYDVMASVGTWNQADHYTSVEETCLAITYQGAPCFPANGGRFVLDGTYRPGSLSMLLDSGPEGNHAFFGQLKGTPPNVYRDVFIVASSSFDPSP